MFESCGLHLVAEVITFTAHMFDVVQRPVHSAQKIIPQASSAGCWPMTPVRPESWVCLDLLMMYGRLVEQQGVSITGN